MMTRKMPKMGETDDPNETNKTEGEGKDIIEGL